MSKKLIEVALPLEAINKESAREKSIRHGHPSTLHLWWSRKPTATARAVIWASLVDDPSSHPEQFHTEEAQTAERERLFHILEKLVVWENSNNPEVLDAAKAEIMKSTGGKPPALLDPFAGGGSIPLEAQRLGLEAHAHDLNPVAVMINKAMIEIPPKFAGQPPVHPDASALEGGWSGAAGLAEDVRYYGEWMKQEAFQRIGHLYPKVKDESGKEHTAIAWIWARTVRCPNPACECEIPLTSSFILSKKKGRESWVKPTYTDGKLHFHVYNGPYDPKLENGTRKGKKALFCCPFCGDGIVNGDYADKEASAGKIGVSLMAVVAECDSGRIYISPDEATTLDLLNKIDAFYRKNSIEDTVSHAECRGTFASNAQGRHYGFFEFCDYFTQRQLIALSTLTASITRVMEKIVADGGTKEYAGAVGVYLSFVVDKLSDYHSSICSWHNSGEKMRNTFGVQGIPMTWNYAEGNLFSSSSGSFDNMLDWVYKCIVDFPVSKAGEAHQFDAQSDCGLRNVMVSTDPPYYNNVCYSDLSDFFYVWMRQSLKDIYPNLFRTMLVPKVEELVATPYRFDGDMEQAKSFFEDGMFHTCQQIYNACCENIPVSIYYAYKQADTDKGSNQTASTGWETILSAIVKAGFIITGTWPIRTEMTSRAGAKDTNSLASSIVLICRKRPADAPMCTRRDFINTLKRELKPALQKLQASNIAPVDLAQSAIGPGMGVYSRYSKVLEADGTPMSVRAALQIINQELDLYFNEQDGELDKESRFCVELYTQCAFNDIKFGEADVLARAKNTSVDKLRADGVLYSEKGVVHLLTREEIPTEIDQNKGIWLLAQQLTRAMETDGVEGAAKIVAGIFTSEPERAKALAYRLFSLAERRGWAGEAFAYNSLIVAWPDVQSRAAELRMIGENVEQQSLY